MRFLLAVDGSDGAQHAFNYAAALLRPRSDQLHIITVIPASRAAAAAAATEAGQAFLSEEDVLAWDLVSRCHTIASAADIETTSEVVRGPVKATILEKADSFNADVIIVGTRGLGTIKRILLGSVSTHVLAYSRRSVLVVRHCAMPRVDPATPRHFLLGCDISPGGKAALQALLQLARPGDSALLVHAFHNMVRSESGLARGEDVVSLESAASQREATAQRDYLDQAVKICQASQIVATQAISFGDPRVVLPQAASDAGQAIDLAVVGCRRTPSTNWWFMGSVSMDVAHHMACPAVLVVKTPSS